MASVHIDFGKCEVLSLIRTCSSHQKFIGLLFSPDFNIHILLSFFVHSKMKLHFIGSYLKAAANVERAIIKAMERQYNDILTPLKDSIPKRLGMQVQKLARRQSTTYYSIPSQVS